MPSGSVAVLLFVAALQLFQRLPEVESTVLVDMSHNFNNATINWPNTRAFSLTVVRKGRDPKGYWYEVNDIAGSEHAGTHLDAPGHFSEGKWTVDQIPLDRLVCPAVVVDISSRADGHPDEQLTAADLREWESKHGRIPDNALLLMNSGWDSRWNNRSAYLGSESRSSDRALHFPGFGRDAVDWILKSGRGIVGVGVDTPSIDNGPSQDFYAHVKLYERNIYGLENVKNIGRLPASGATVYVAPMKIEGGSGAPCRILAVMENGGGSVSAGKASTMIKKIVFVESLLAAYLCAKA